ncbi:MAG: acetyl-CoA carboxylase, biotin carboxyl carrier protein, partial [Alphaproteobacteria bacterium]|nr:acetyl-CoA carboxylase, biotin carboxyl carrier protein [Alphaproteobacteria bacterium]
MKSKKKPAAKPAPAPKSGIDADAVRDLAKLLKETGLTEIEIEHKGARIRVSRGGGVAAAAPAPAP